MQTPHLDRLAARSARYVNGYVPTSVCRPSLVTLLTGLYPHQHHIYFNHPPPGFGRLTRSPEIDKSAFDAARERATDAVRTLPTLPRRLASVGYATLQTGKYWEGHWRNAGFTDGMTLAEPKTGAKYGNKTLANGDVVAHGNGDHGLAIGRETMEPIDSFVGACNDRPFFIWYAPFLPHLPHDSPQQFFDLYAGNPEIPRHKIPYYAACSQFDATVGELLEILNQHGQTENTLIAFVIDNGFVPDERRPMAGGDFNYTHTSKRSPFDPGLKTPILLCWPGQTRSATITDPVSSIDLVPTLFAAAGVESDSLELPGINLLPSARGDEDLDPQRPVFGEIYPGDASALHAPEADIAYRWVRQGDLKLITVHRQRGRDPWGAYLKRDALFDLGEDPQETMNLVDAPQYKKDAARLRRILDEWWSP